MNQEPELDNTVNRFMTVKQLCKANPAFKEGGIRHFIFHEERNGFKGVFPKMGRRRLIDVPKFLERISQNGDGNETLSAQSPKTVHFDHGQPDCYCGDKQIEIED